MGERKVLNKYFPPDFDPSKVPRGKRVRSEETQMKVRMMLPMSVRCNTCGNFMYKGTKFNTRMEDVKGEAYLGIKIFRFYYRCTNCSAEFCMKTDPKTADYMVEGGASRNYEPWRDKEKTAAAAVASKEEEEKGNAMKALENRTLDSKREMDILTALDEMRSLKARHEGLSTEEALAALRRAAEGEAAEQGPADLDAEDEAAVRQMLLQRAGFVRRLSDSDEEREEAARLGAGVGGKGAAGDGGGPDDQRSKKARLRDLGGGLGPRSVAAAAWEDGDEDGGDAEETAAAAAVDGGAKGGVNGIAAVAAADGEEEGARDGGKGAAQQAQQAQKPAVKAAPPPSVPSFMARPATVVVRKKSAVAVVAAAQPPPLLEEEKEKDASDGGALPGLAGYGSSSGGDSD